MEQNVDIPAVGGCGAGGGLSGFLPGQNYSMTVDQIVDNPVPRPDVSGDLQGFLRGQGSTAFSEQIPEFPGSAASSSDSPGQAGQGVFSTFPRKKKSAKIPRSQGSELGELMDAVSLAGVSSVAQHGVRLLLLVAEKQEWCFLVCSSGLPSYPVAWSTCWCRLCLVTSPSWWLLEESPDLRAASSRCLHLEIWMLPSPSCLGVGVRRIFGTRLVNGCCLWSTAYGFFGTRALLGSTVVTCSTGGFGRISAFSSLR